MTWSARSMVFVAVLLFVSVFVLQKESFGDAKEIKADFELNVKNKTSTDEVDRASDEAIEKILQKPATAVPAAPGATPAITPEQRAAIKDILAKAEEQKTNLEQTFKFKFGAGILYTNYTGKRVVDTATEKNGVVSIDEGDNHNVGLMLETHNFIGKVSTNTFWGPFLGIKPDEGELIDAAMLGLMLGFKYKRYDAAINNQTFNIGFGYVVDPKEKVLANGYVEGMPLPAGATNVATKLVTKTGWGLIVSYGF